MRRSLAARSCLVAALALLPPLVAEAGIGSFDDATNKFNIVVSVRWNATPAELTAVCADFETASGILLDATDGGNQFGLVLLANNSTASDAADYWVMPSSGRSGADTGTFGTAGYHVTLYRGPVPQSRYEEVIVHETAHYIYCVRDEYEGTAVGGCADDPCPALGSTACAGLDSGGECINVAASAACLMEGPDDNDSEFCWSGDHDPDGDTEQHCNYCESCWETMAASSYDLVMPAGTPVAAPPAADPIACIELEGTPRIVLVLDRSASMGTGTRFADMKKAAKLVVDLVETGSYLGVVSFHGTTPGGPGDAAINWPLQTIDGAGDRNAARAAIDSLVLGGLTNYSAGLDKALDEFERVGTDASNQSVIFLSDGLNNRPQPDPDAALAGSLNELDDAGIAVNTIGIGDDITIEAEIRLLWMALETSGNYNRTPVGTLPLAVATPVDLKPVFARFWARSQERTELLCRGMDVPGGSAFVDSVRIETGAVQASFLCSWRSQSDSTQVEFLLMRPDGMVISPGTSGVEYVTSTSGQYSFYKVPPAMLQPGMWRMRMRPLQTATVPVSYQVFAKTPEIFAGGRTALPRPYRPGEAVPVMVRSYYNSPLTDFPLPGGSRPGDETRSSTFSVSGRLLRWQDGATAHLFALSDSGLMRPASGDHLPGDGIFTGVIPASITQQLANGSYTVAIDIVNDGGAEYAGQHAKAVPGEIEAMSTVPLFRRTVFVPLVISDSLRSGVPGEFQEGAIEASPPAILTSRPNPSSGSTRIEYRVAAAGRVQLDVYSVQGRLVRSLVKGPRDSGVHEVSWDGRDADGREMPTGVYFAVLRSGGATTSHKLQILR